MKKDDVYSYVNRDIKSTKNKLPKFYLRQRRRKIYKTIFLVLLSYAAIALIVILFINWVVIYSRQ